jgi:hypothetical protein
MLYVRNLKIDEMVKNEHAPPSMAGRFDADFTSLITRFTLRARQAGATGFRSARSFRYASFPRLTTPTFLRRALLTQCSVAAQKRRKPIRVKRHKKQPFILLYLILGTALFNP